MNDIAAHIKLILEGANNASVRMQKKKLKLKPKACSSQHSFRSTPAIFTGILNVCILSLSRDGHVILDYSLIA